MFTAKSDKDGHIRTRNVSYFKPVSRKVAFKHLNENDKDITLPHQTNNFSAPAPIQQKRALTDLQYRHYICIKTICSSDSSSCHLCFSFEDVMSLCKYAPGGRAIISKGTF